MPEKLRGMALREAQGARICFGFTLKTCSKAAVGESCDRGRRACCKPGCFGKHALPDHSWLPAAGSWRVARGS
eukprot:11640802-Alexandrium_andersonii.AAC.1